MCPADERRDHPQAVLPHLCRSDCQRESPAVPKLVRPEAEVFVDKSGVRMRCLPVVECGDKQQHRSATLDSLGRLKSLHVSSRSSTSSVQYELYAWSVHLHAIGRLRRYARCPFCSYRQQPCGFPNELNGTLAENKFLTIRGQQLHGLSGLFSRARTRAGRRLGSGAGLAQDRAVLFLPRSAPLHVSQLGPGLTRAG